MDESPKVGAEALGEIEVDFAEGFFAVFRGLQLILTRPELLRWTLIPSFIVGAIFLCGGMLGIAELIGFLPEVIANFAEGWIEAPRAVRSTVELLLHILAWPISILALIFFLYLIARLVAAPFHVVLAERALIARGVVLRQPPTLLGWVWINIRMVGVGLIKTVILSALGLVLFIFGFFPLLNLVAGFSLLLVVAYDVIDFSFEAMSWSWRKRQEYIFRIFPAWAGFATMLGLILMIPGLSILLFPAAVVGATTLIRSDSPKSDNLAAAKVRGE